MTTAASILQELKSKGSPAIRKLYARHNMSADRVFGVKVGDLKLIAKSIKSQQTIACELLDSGNMEAMYLGGMVAHGSKVTAAQLNEWLSGLADLQMITEYTIPWLAIENPEGLELARSWIKSDQEHIAAAGWCTYSGLIATTPDADLDLAEIEALMHHIVQHIRNAPNRVRYTMNNFVIAVGTYIEPLHAQAKSIAKAIGVVVVDMGETACEVPDALSRIEKALASGKLGKKRKTVRC